MLHPPTLELGGQTRTLVCDIGALATLEDMGHDPLALVNAVANGGANFRQVVALTAALLWQDGVSEKDVKRWVTMDRFVEVSEAVGLALRHAFPQGEASEEANPPRRGTGRKSSSSVPSAA